VRISHQTPAALWNFSTLITPLMRTGLFELGIRQTGTSCWLSFAKEALGTLSASFLHQYSRGDLIPKKTVEMLKKLSA
jgi:hypothetical protein